VLLAAIVASAQIQLGGFGQTDRGAQAKRQHVELLTDAIAVEAGRPQDVELRFRVEPGFHINSHTPKDELLIPTVLTVDAGGLRVRDEQYPAGTAFRLAIGAGETLEVYEGEFRVRLRVTARRGASTLTAELRYQACDSASCFPPRTLPVHVSVTAR
jgi:DsbC/DsbD-like thiol-disulfide interchange protein